MKLFHVETRCNGNPGSTEHGGYPGYHGNPGYRVKCIFWRPRIVDLTVHIVVPLLSRGECLLYKLFQSALGNSVTESMLSWLACTWGLLTVFFGMYAILKGIFEDLEFGAL